MSNIWITSDLHFNHDKEFLYGPRGFNSIEEHDNYIIENWNKKIGYKDTVYVLGDLMFGKNPKETIDKVAALRGDIKIIIGNHDTDNKIRYYRTLPWVEVLGYSNILKFGKYRFYISHYPTICGNYDDDKPLKTRMINLCGHTHTQDKFNDFDKGLIYHCELDAHNNEPVLIKDIIKDIKEKI